MEVVELPEEKRAADSGSQQSASASSAWSDLLKSAGEKLLPVLLTGGTLAGFVALAGSAVLWSRFQAIDVPPDQVVSIVPEGEAIAIGSTILVVLGFLGALATLTVYLVDRGGRATPGMSRALLLILTIEAGVAIMFASDTSSEVRVIAIEVLAIVFGVALWSTYVGGLMELEDELPEHGGEERPPPMLEETAFWINNEDFKLKGGPVVAVLEVAVFISGITFWLSWLFGASPNGRWIAALAAGGATLVVAVGIYWLLFNRQKREREKALAYRQPTWWGRWYPSPLYLQLRRMRGQDRQKSRPPKFKLSPIGDAFIVALAIIAVVVPAWIIRERWLAFSLGALFVIGNGLWRIVDLSGKRFFWFGLAVFISVPLFGALTMTIRNLLDPQVQALALIRNTDGPDEAIKGIYVAETDDRVYFANVATEGCEGDPMPGSGRLLWVKSDEVVAMSIGPLQDLKDAGKSALEMAYALTPSVETPAAGAVSLTPEEEETEDIKKARENRLAKEVETGVAGLDQRLQDPGPAVRPNFGSGLRLSQENASPGNVIELRLSGPNSDGFGSRPKGRVVRLNGVPISPLEEETTEANQAEYVKTRAGTVLGLQREKEYGLYKGQWIELDSGRRYEERKYEGWLYFKLKKATDIVDPPAPGPGGEHFLRFEEDNAGNDRVVEGQEVSVDSSDPEPVQPILRRQAWSNELIRFRVPDNASSGVITVECEQLANSPLLRVARPPTARIVARMRQNSPRVSLNSRVRNQDSEKVTLRWMIDGHKRGHRQRISIKLPPRFRPYPVTLLVKDKWGNSDSATLRLMRLPTALFDFDDPKPNNTSKQIKMAARALRESVRARPPTAIELHGNTDGPGSRAYNLGLSLERDDEVAEKLLTRKGPPGTVAIPVREVGFGETCPVDPRPGRRPRNRRVDVFVLEEGVSIKPAKGCLAGKFKKFVWRPSASEGDSEK